jgi:drug/metabolite transporter (DMT)-like permease
MENWIILAIIFSFAAGMFSFTLKIAAEKGIPASRLMMHVYSWGVLFSFLLFYNSFQIGDIMSVVIFAFLHQFFYYLAIITRVRSLEHIDSTIYFPLYKTIGPIIILIVSFLFFHESLNVSGWIGVILGIVTSMLLISKKESHRQGNLSKGLILMFVGTLLTTLTVMVGKIVRTGDFNIELYILLSMCFGLLLSLITFLRPFKIQERSSLGSKNKKIYLLGFLSGIALFGTIYSFTLALEGHTAIVYTINSFSILIPVLLSVFFFKEHFNIKKGAAILSSILAGIFFIK